MMRRMSGADRSNARAGDSCTAAVGAPVEEGAPGAASEAFALVVEVAASEELAFVVEVAAGVGCEVDGAVATGVGEGG